MQQPIKITIYRWAGSFGPFKVKIPCGECSLTGDIVRDILENELSGVKVEVEVKDWLSHWWEPLMKGAYHAPIVMVDGDVVSQGKALNRGLITEAVIGKYVGVSEMQGNVIFGKAGCPYCVKAKAHLDSLGVEYTYRDVVKEPAALYEMIPRVKEKIGYKTPVTVPQIWIDGNYVGGYDQVVDYVTQEKVLSNFKLVTEG